MKVLIATEKPFAPVAVQGIKDVIEAGGHEFVLLEKGTKEDLKKAVADVEGLIVRSDKIDKEVFDCAPNLKVVVRAGAGYDNIDLAEATARKICVMNTPGQNSNAVAELVFGMLVMVCRNYYNGTSGTELKEKTIGIHAYGQVGKNVARIAKGFGMNVMAYDPFVPSEVMANDGVVSAESINELYSKCDVVSLHIPANNETKKSVNKDIVGLLPKNGILVNTARKEVIDEESLVDALTERADTLDRVFVKPDNADLMKEKFGDRVFFTPKKMGAQTSEANIKAGIAAAEQVVAYLKDGWNKFQVNK